MNDQFDCGDEVAIMPAADSPAADVREIAAIVYVGTVFFRLADGRMFATIGGKRLLSNSQSYAVRATDEHRAALKARSRIPHSAAVSQTLFTSAAS